jgi:hypothetical protein
VTRAERTELVALEREITKAAGQGLGAWRQQSRSKAP